MGIWTPGRGATPGNDTYVGDSAPDIVSGAGGDDQLDGRDGADTLTGGVGNDTLLGGADNDTLAGNSGADTLEGGDGDDRLDGGNDDDTLRGGAGADILVDVAGLTTTIEAGDGDDVITVGASIKAGVIDGGAGLDQLNASGAFGTRVISNIEVLNTLGGAVTTTAAQLEAFETIRFSAANPASRVELRLAAAGAIDLADELLGRAVLFTGSAGNDTITTSSGADTISGAAGDDTLDGADGADVLTGGIGNDTLIGGAGGDTLVGNSGADTLNGGDGDDGIDGGNDADQIDAGAGNDIIAGGAGNDVIVDGAGSATTIDAGDGDDVITLGTTIKSGVINGGAGLDQVNGNGVFGTRSYIGTEILNTQGGQVSATAAQLEAFDTIRVSAASPGAQVQLLLSEAGAVDLAGELVGRSVNFTGSDGNDVITTSGGADSVNGAAGDDQLNGNDGADVLTGGIGHDILAGGAGADTLVGNTGADTLSGGDGDDQLDGGADIDTLNGGTGNDAITDLSGASTTIDAGDGDDVITLGVNVTGGTISGGAGLDQLNASGAFGTRSFTGLEILNTQGGAVIATAAQLEAFDTIRHSAADATGQVQLALAQAGTVDLADELLGRSVAFTGSTGADTVTTSNGNDIISTGDGDDAIIQSAASGGRDAVTGGAGNDTYRVTTTGGDTISLLTRAQALAAGVTGLAASAEVIVTRNGTGNAAVIGVLDGIEVIDIDGVLTTVASLDLNAPAFTSGTAASIDEGTDLAYTATAIPAHGGALTYTLSGTDAALFAINANTGEVTFLAAPDYENPADAGGNNVYDIEVTASDGLNDTTQAVAITVQNRFDTAPMFTSSTTAGVDENATIAYTAVATTDGASVTYSLGNAGVDKSLFTIDAATGVVSFVTPPDYENPSDSDGDNVYNIAVTATAATISTAFQVAITVGDVNEAPVFTSGTTASVNENATAAYTAAATDDDGETLTYSLGGADAALFAIDASTGAVTFLAAPDFETPADADGDNVYAITVTASDGAISTVQEVSVTITNVNDVPGFTSASAVTIDEGGTTAYTATATDEEGDALNYSLNGTDAALFTIDEDTGVVTFNTAPDFEAPTDAGGDNVYNIAVTASDGANGTTRNVAITVADVLAGAQIAFGAGQPITVVDATDRRVNTTTAPVQSLSSTTALAGGGHVVVWASTDQDGSGDGVYLQRYAANGTAQGSEIRVNTTTANYQSYPTVTGLGDGGYLVSWMSEFQDGSSWGVYTQRYDASGAPVGAEVRVNTFTANEQSYPRAAATPDGGYVVTWSSNTQEGNGYEIYFQRYDAAGVAQGGEVRANTHLAQWQIFSSIAVQPDGDFVIVWNSLAQDGSSWGVFAQRFSQVGVALGSEFQINQTSDDIQFGGPAAALAGGGFVVVWHAGNGSAYSIYARIFDADGVAVGDEFPVNLSGHNHQSPDVVALPDGGFIVGYERQTDSLDIYAQRFDASGNAVGGEILLNHTTVGDQYHVPPVGGGGLALLANGLLVQTFTSNDDIYHRRFDVTTAFSGVEDDPAIPLPITLTLGDPGETITSVVLSGLPAGSILSAGTSNANGTAWTFGGTPPSNLSFTPPANYNGVFTLTVTATSLIGGDVERTAGAHQVTVAAINDAPIAVNDTVVATKNTPITFNLATNDQNPDANDPLTLTHVNGVAVAVGSQALPGGHSYLNYGDGQIRLTPANGFAGQFSFTYTVRDSAGQSSTATASVTVNQLPIASADVYRGMPDVLVANLSGSSATFFGTGNAVLVQGGALLPAGEEGTIADLNGDGLPDVLMTHHGGVLTRFFNNGTANPFTAGVGIPAPGGRDTVVGDLDGDGDLDLLNLVTGGSHQVLLNTGAGGFATGSTLPSAGSHGGALGDIDRDGDLDVVIANDGFFGVGINNGAGVFAGTSGLGVGATHFKISLADVDGDRDLDVLAATSGGVFLYFNGGNGLSYTSAVQIQSSVAIGATFADVDGDGDADIIGDGVTVFRNNGLGQFSQTGPSYFSLGGTVREIVAGDIDLDGDLDLAVGIAGGMFVGVNNGSGAFTISAPYYSGAFVPDVAIGQLNSDGLAANGGYVFRVLDNDRDPDGHSYFISSIHGQSTAMAVTSASGAMVMLGPDQRTIQYNASVSATFKALALGETATDTFTYTIQDTAGGTSAAQVTVLVRGVNDAPVLVAGGPYSTELGSGITFDLSGSYDPDAGGSIVSVDWDLDSDGQYDDLTGANVTLNGGVLAALGFQAVGPHSVAVRLTDNLGATTAGVINFTVAANFLPPLVFDLDGDGIALTTGVTFDFDGDGGLDTGGWILPGDALLVLDRNGDGRITSGAEISFVQDLPGASTDLEGLAAHDANGDGYITAADSIFTQLQLWNDINGDAVSDPGELASLDASGIVSIRLVSTPGEGADASGNIIHGWTEAALSSGGILRVADVGLRYTDGFGTMAAEPTAEPVDPEALRHELSASMAFRADGVAALLEDGASPLPTAWLGGGPARSASLDAGAAKLRGMLSDEAQPLDLAEVAPAVRSWSATDDDLPFEPLHAILQQDDQPGIPGLC